MPDPGSTVPAGGPREAILDRLRQVFDLSYRLSRDDLDTSIEPITDPERDLWSAAALLHGALHRHGIAVRDEYWEILAGAVAVPAEARDTDELTAALEMRSRQFSEEYQARVAAEQRAITAEAKVIGRDANLRVLRRNVAAALQVLDATDRADLPGSKLGENVRAALEGTS